MQATKSIPNISLLFDYELDQDIDAIRDMLKNILQSWGFYNRSEYKHLSYAQIQWGNGKSSKRIYPLTPEERAMMDKCMSRLLDVSPNLFELIKLRYIQGKTYQYIGANHLRLTERSARRHINLSERMVYNILASLYGSDKRQVISTALLDDRVIEKVNYYKLK